MTLNTREELEQLLEDIQSRLSVVETAQTKPEDKSEDKTEDEKQEETKKESEVESEDEIEKLLNA